MSRLILVFLLTLFSSNLFSQKEVFQHIALTNANKGIKFIRYEDFIDISGTLDSNYINLPVHIVTTSKGVFLNIKGTGRLYHWNIYQKEFVRIDSTKLEGYNHGHLLYSYNDSIYSFGGYGFWTLYGITRYFSNVNNQWDLKKTNIVVPSEFDNNNAFYWIDDEEGILYLIKKYFDLYRYSGINKKEPAKVLSFHIKSGTWSELGTPIFNPNPKEPIIGIHKNGLLFNENGILKLMSFKDNSIRLISKIKSDSTNAFIYGSTRHLFYTTNYWAYFADVKTGKVDSVLIEPKDIGPVEKKIYTTPLKSIKLSKYLLLIPLILGIGFLLTRKKMQKQEKYRVQKNISGFNQTEIDILQLLSKRGLNNEVVTIPELNRILGLSGKSPDVQKKYRSDILTLLSSKLLEYHIDLGDPIKRKRSLEDGRVFEYYVEEEVGKKIISILDNLHTYK